MNDDQARIAAAIKKYSQQFSLDPKLVACVVWQESKGDKWAGRIEQKSKIWFTLFGRTRQQMAGYVPPEGDVPELWDETCWRASSYGCMQVLGETARVLGFRGKYLAALYEIETGIEYGCRKLAKCFARAESDAEDATLPKNRSVTEQALIYYNGAVEYAGIILGHLTSGVYVAVLPP